jgi:hypothetical protein
MTQQPDSGAGKIRAAFIKLGIDASCADILREVGDCMGYWGGDPYGYKSYPPGKSYINTYRRKMKAELKKHIPLEVYDWI